MRREQEKPLKIILRTRQLSFWVNSETISQGCLNNRVPVEGVAAGGVSHHRARKENQNEFFKARYSDRASGKIFLSQKIQ